MENSLNRNTDEQKLNNLYRYPNRQNTPAFLQYDCPHISENFQAQICFSFKPDLESLVVFTIWCKNDIVL